MVMSSTIRRRRGVMLAMGRSPEARLVQPQGRKTTKTRAGWKPAVPGRRLRRRKNTKKRKAAALEIGCAGNVVLGLIHHACTQLVLRDANQQTTINCKLAFKAFYPESDIIRKTSRNCLKLRSMSGRYHCNPAERTKAGTKLCGLLFGDRNRKFASRVRYCAQATLRRLKETAPP
jgi:hypothetical protein